MINHAEKDPLEVHKVDTALELIELLRGTHNLWRGHREQWGFRGQADSKWRLVPSAFRDGWEACLPKCLRSPAEEAVVRQQHNEWEAFLRFFRLADETGLYVPGAEQVRTLEMEQQVEMQIEGSAWPFDDLVEGLAIAQHHGIPTRLLDFTLDGLVAAYFAALSAITKRNKDPTPPRFSVWAVNLGFLHYAWGNWLNRRFRVVQVPLARNPFLQAQRGFFIYDISARKSWPPPPMDELVMAHSRKGSTWERLADLCPRMKFMEPPVIHRFDVPNTEAEQLLQKLYQHERISKAHLMPTMDNVTETLRFMLSLEP